MATCTFQSPFAQVRGAFQYLGAGCVATGSTKAGNVLRRYVVPSNPNTAAQILARTRLTTAAQAFAGLTRELAKAWNDAALAYNRNNSLDVEHGLSGINYFVQVNTLRKIAGQVISTAVPTGFLTTPAFTPRILIGMTEATLEMTAGDVTPGSTPHWLVEMTPAWDAPARQPRKNDYRLLPALSPGLPMLNIATSGEVVTQTLDSTVAVEVGLVYHLKVTNVSKDFVPSATPTYFLNVVAEAE